MRDVPLPFADGAIDLLLRLERGGFKLWSSGDTLFVEPGHRLTPADGQAIRDHKSDILAYLDAYPADAPPTLSLAAQGRLEAMNERGGGDVVPVASDGPHGLGACFSCGEALEAGREYGRCPPCRDAATVRYWEAKGFVDPFNL